MPRKPKPETPKQAGKRIAQMPASFKKRAAAFKEELEKIAQGDDPEATHGSADEFMEAFLEGIGYDCSAFRKMQKFYA